jgi:hypothetical protein
MSRVTGGSGAPGLIVMTPDALIRELRSILAKLDVLTQDIRDDTIDQVGAITGKEASSPGVPYEPPQATKKAPSAGLLLWRLNRKAGGPKLDAPGSC